MLKLVSEAVGLERLVLEILLSVSASALGVGMLLVSLMVICVGVVSFMIEYREKM